jgi:hypothetical protein
MRFEWLTDFRFRNPSHAALVSGLEAAQDAEEIGMASANLFVDWGGDYHDPAWQVTNGIQFQPGVATAYDLFQAAQNSPPFTIASQGSGAGLYITAIDGVVQNAGGNGYWWVYFVNGTQPTVGCDAYLLNDGDSIAWDYKHFSSGFRQAPHPGLKPAQSPKPRPKRK